jgi:hypothetical protein
MIGISRNSIPDYFLLLEKVKLINRLYNNTQGIRGLGKMEKIFLNNTNLMYNFSEENINVGNIRETFFLNQLSINHDVKLPDSGDFLIDNKFIFEISGKNKNQKQIENIDNSFIVKDDIEYTFGNIIPLWHFGMMY